MADDTVIFHGVSIEPEHIDVYNRPPNITLLGVSIKVSNNNADSSGGGESSTSKKVYLTNKGNIMINPNDTILIEI